MLVFGNFNVHHKDWSTYFGGNDRSRDLTQIINLPTQISDCDSHSPVHLVLSLISNASICSTMAFPPLEHSDHVVASVSIDFSSNSKLDVLFHHIAYDYFCAD